MSATDYFSPAKINLFLAVTGRRADGFHDLLSVVAPISFGDRLRVEPAVSGFTLSCDDPSVPNDGRNLILKAAQAYATATGWTGGADFHLEKKIPIGAGLGGGSGNAVTALRALNDLTGGRLDATGMARLAADLGSDCPLFLHGGPLIMRGRGEMISPLFPGELARISGRRILVFKPAFSISTPWAFGELARLAAAGARDAYMESRLAEAKIEQWRNAGGAPLESLLLNTMEAAAFGKYLALPAMVRRLRERFGVEARMSGSGSACFALLESEADAQPLVAAVREAWGESSFIAEAKLL